jgi:hypothetical protein
VKIILSHHFIHPKLNFPMSTMRQFCRAFWGLAVFAAILASCGDSATPPAPTIVANPLITFDAAGAGGFAVTPESIAGAAKVAIKILDKNGVERAASEAAPGAAQVFNIDTAAARPLRVNLRYLSADGQQLASDNFQIDDRLKKSTGMPDMDVVMGVSGDITCPNPTQNITVTTVSGVSTFTWEAATTYEVTLTCGGTSRKFALKPTAGSGGNAGTVKVYDKSNQTCLNAVSPEPVSSKEIALTTISNGCTVRGYEDSNGTKTITIKHNTCSGILVKK